MWVARERSEWDRFAVLMAFVGNRMPFADGKLDPQKLNPYRRPWISPEVRRQLEERRQRNFFRKLEAGLVDHAKQMRG
jgi:hypothetical protein